jgi:hypothetical protein
MAASHEARVFVCSCSCGSASRGRVLCSEVGDTGLACFDECGATQIAIPGARVQNDAMNASGFGCVWAASIALALTACTDAKTEQCNELIGRANLSQTVIKGITVGGDGEGLVEAAKKIDNEVDWVKGAKVTDPTLVKFRDEYAGDLEKTAAALRALAQLGGDLQSDAAKKIVDDSDQIDKAQSKLVADINAYCSGR